MCNNCKCKQDQLVLAVPDECRNVETRSVEDIEDEINGMLDYARELDNRHHFEVNQMIDYIQGTIRDIFAKNKNGDE